jgi:hypothetical protein
MCVQEITMNENENYAWLSDELLGRYGELIGGTLLSKVLGYSSIDAMKRAIERDTLKIPTFFVPGRRGRFALTSDVAKWLIICRTSQQEAGTHDVPENFKKSSGKNLNEK